MKDYRRKTGNEEVQRELEYFSEDYDDEIKAEPRPLSNGQTCSALRIESPIAQRPNGRRSAREGSVGGRKGTRRKEKGDSNMRTGNKGNARFSLPPLLAMNLIRNEAGDPLQSSMPHGFIGNLIKGKSSPKRFNEQKPRNIVYLEELKAKLRSLLSQKKKFIKTYLVVHNIKQKDGEITRAFVT
nr:hypothetical protein [Tanacetum cinerariifolium]